MPAYSVTKAPIASVFWCVLIFSCANAIPVQGAEEPTPDELRMLEGKLKTLQARIQTFEASQKNPTASEQQLFADAAIFAKAVDWMVRHQEFPKNEYVKQGLAALEQGTARIDELENGTAAWQYQIGTTIRGYRSTIDESLQPYAVTLPDGFDGKAETKWPLYVKLHGRYDAMNEVNFISRHAKAAHKPSQDWIQLDVYGRGNNAYRWAGETDVFEAMNDVVDRFEIDEDRITLHGFSMGGAGAWHLGLHYPDLWSSVGPGAGFVDFYIYQKQSERRPVYQHATLGIYDAIDYALNAANVPICTYGGENDAQLIASTSVVAAAKPLNVDIKLLIGPGMGHKFHPDSFREFMDFHKTNSAVGRKQGGARKSIRFTTRTLKYNQCDWVRIEGVEKVYEPSTITASIHNGDHVYVTTENINLINIDHGTGKQFTIDNAAIDYDDSIANDSVGVYFRKTNSGWEQVAEREGCVFGDTPVLHKRHGLQGPIDDAFTAPFVCVTGSRTPNSVEHHAWAHWTLQRFTSEFDKWLRGTVEVVSDQDVTDDIVASKNLVLFGAPASNTMIARILPHLPLSWKKDELIVNGQRFSTADHGVCLIYPNPLNPKRYVVINSGHTFHEKDFRNSNSWLFPRLGDIAVQRFQKRQDDGYDETTVWAANFDSRWALPN